MPRETRSGFMITQIKQLGGRIFDKLLAREGVDAFNGAQGRILYVLWQNEGVPMRELAKKTGLARNTLTSMLDRMEAQGLAVRTPDRRDKRSTLISLTDAARALRSAYDDVSGAMNELYFKGFTDAEIDVFEGYLKRIVQNLEEEENREQDFHAPDE